MRNESTKVVFELVNKNKNVVAVTADNGNSVYEEIRTMFPEQYIDYGISECNMVASAAGLAANGKIPFLYTVTNFMSMRAYEFIRNTVCVANYNVKFLGRSAGLVSSNMGMTHQGTEDLALLRSLPNLLVITPATPMEAKQATYAAYEYDGPVYIRLEGFNEPELYDERYKFSIGKGTTLREGNDITVVCIGTIVNKVLEIAEALKNQGISIRVLNMPTIKPIDEELIVKAARETKKILTVEEHSIYGGLGSAVAEVLAENGINVRFKRMGLVDFCISSGNRQEIRELNGLGTYDIQQQIKKLLNG